MRKMFCGSKANYRYDVIEHQYGINLTHVPHELTIMEWLMVYEKYKPNSNFSEKFLSFQEQYFPEYNFFDKNYFDPLGSVVIELSINILQLKQKLFDELHNGSISNQDGVSKAYEFGNICTEFVIKTMGVSVISSDDKQIFTSSDNCDKEFDKYLKDGYRVFKMKKLLYTRDDDELLGRYIECPALPMKNNFYNVDEYIEDKNHKFQKVLTK